uniref:Uncharacterized protein n=1 Tax=Klebsiella pneumoniae TaxID=573 RepID=A0A8B0SVV7_KLEPN|nr:hypothetical protein [Klebsiella pneumoniae]
MRTTIFIELRRYTILNQWIISGANGKRYSSQFVWLLCLFFYRMQEHDSQKVTFFNNKSDDISRIALKKGKKYMSMHNKKSDSYF